MRPQPNHEAIWDIIDAKKVKFRVNKHGINTHSASEWKITFQNLQNDKQQTLTYSAEHRHSSTKTSHGCIPKEKLRAKRYPSGASGIVKKLTLKTGQTSSTGIPTELALKSIFDRSATAFLKEIKQAPGTISVRDILQDFGSPFFVVERSRIKNKRLTKKVAAIQRFNGNGNDLIDSIILATSKTKKTQPTKQIQARELLTPLYTEKRRLQCIVELLAHYQHFHNEVKRPVLDIKLDNIMPLIANDITAGLIPIDLDSSFGRHKLWTEQFLRVDVSEIVNNTKYTAFDLPCSIDFSTLAIVLTHAFYALKISSFSIKFSETHCRYYIGKKTKINATSDSTVKLILAMYKTLKAYKSHEWQTAEQIITDTLGENSDAHKWYKAKLNELSQRANMRKAHAKALIEKPKPKQPSAAIKTAALASQQRRMLQHQQAHATHQTNGAGGGAGASEPSTPDTTNSAPPFGLTV